MLTSYSSSQSVLAAAVYLCEKSDWTLTQLQIHKLLYLANMYHLVHYDEPIVDQKFEAWIYGPVQPHLYHDLKHYGPDVVKKIPTSLHRRVEGTHKTVLDFVFDEYGSMSVSQLIELTHRDGGGWAKNWNPRDTFRGSTIEATDIRKEFQLLTEGS